MIRAKQWWVIEIFNELSTYCMWGLAQREQLK